MSTYLLKRIKHKTEWESLVKSRTEANFLQSYNWGLFQQRIDKKFFPLAVFAANDQSQDRKPVALAMVIKEEAKRGDYLTIAGGPLIDWQSDQTESVLKFLSQEFKKLAKKENCLFIRIRPQVESSLAVRQLMEKLDYQPAPMHLTADLTLQLDLSQSEGELLAQMRKNTRYYIRRAKRDGVVTKISANPAEIKEFNRWQLYLANKHNFVPFSYQFLNQQFKTFMEDDQALLIHSYHQKKLLSSAFVIFYNGEAVYHYGVSTPVGREMPGSYATQWAAIKEAKKRGCQTYNFWGIAPEDEPEHRFAGVSMFKRGFGGKEVQYLPAQDLVVSPFYVLTKGFELVRKKVRGL